VFNFAEYDDMGEYLKEITRGGADKVIDAVGMDGKKHRLNSWGKN
jgi:S-(hydroxymethyl)glutathione dehydrogenase/alcohol dehydrogenase